MPLTDEQVATLRTIQHAAFEATADLGTDNDSSSPEDQVWAERVTSLIAIIDSLTGGSRRVIVELFFDADVSPGTGNGLLYGLGQDGLDFTATVINARLIQLDGQCPHRFALADRIREIAARTPLYLISEQNIKTSLRRVDEHLSGINVVEMG